MKMPSVKATADPLLRVMLNRMMRVHPGSLKAPKMSFGKAKQGNVQFKPSSDAPQEIPTGDKNLIFGSGGE